jgi:hypothetical protein
MLAMAAWANQSDEQASLLKHLRFCLDRMN